MRFQWKLLVMMLVLGLVPLGVMRIIGSRAVLRVGDEMSNHTIDPSLAYIDCHADGDQRHEHEDAAERQFELGHRGPFAAESLIQRRHAGQSSFGEAWLTRLG